MVYEYVGVCGREPQKAINKSKKYNYCYFSDENLADLIRIINQSPEERQGDDFEMALVKRKRDRQQWNRVGPIWG